MKSAFLDFVERYKNEFFSYLNRVAQNDKKLLVTGDLLKIYNDNIENTSEENEEVCQMIELIQESIVVNYTIYLEIREKIGYSQFYIINLEGFSAETLSIKKYLKAKEYFVNPDSQNNILTLDFKPFYDEAPSVRDIKSIGSGVEYLNRFLSGQMINDTTKWRNQIFDFIRLHKHNSEQLILNDRLMNPDHLLTNIDKALKKLNEFDEEDSYQKVKHLLQELGFEKGLGKDVKTISDSLELLEGLMNTPDHINLKEFISRIPMIFNISIISVHGYFAQEGVLGMPDTGGQVVYILDQVKALEKALTESLQEAGLEILPKIIILSRLIPNAGNTTCNQRLEKVHGTQNSWILRVPFRTHNPKITDNWISRFEIWPYLEEFADDSYIELLAEFGGRPDLILGNYSDGNLVSYLLAKKFKVTQCCIAHALEKSKYLYSALYWNHMEDHYHFSLQFTADLLAINSANFLITSSFQEIAGTENSIGQYESYKHFTMPDLFRVENGTNLQHTKYNIVSPGVNENIYFPFNEEEDRIVEVQRHISELLFENKEDPEVVGTLDNPNLTPIFSMARLDKVKNITSLVRWFGMSPELQELSNLILVAGKVDRSQSTDREEIEEIDKMYQLIDEYNLHGKIRWIGKLFRKDEAGELYRIIADHRGVFVQPALFEGFGLTVLEAMITGLPVLATKYGGPLEIIQDKKNGFHINPANDEESIEVILKYVRDINSNPENWKKISENAIKRVNERYNWKLYSDRLLSLAKTYGFWKYTTDFAMKGLSAYNDIVYHMLFKPRAKELLEKHNSV